MSGTTSVLTGRTGKFSVDGIVVARCTDWAVSPKLASKSEWGDSDTAGYTARMAGRKDATFSVSGKFDKDEEQYDLFQPGDKAAATLWMRVTTPIYWYFPCAMNDDFSLQVNMDSEEVIGWSSNWGADGIYYHPGHASLPVIAYPTDSDSV